MAANDLFAPPTKEEIEDATLFAPPTKEELAQIQPKKKNPRDFSTDAADYFKTDKESIRKGLNALPSVGGMGGGLVGGVGGGLAAGPPGAIGGEIAGSGAGTYLGAKARDLGAKYLLGDKEPTPEEAARSSDETIGESLKNMALSAGNRAAGPILKEPTVQKGLGYVGSGLLKAGEALTGVPREAIATYAKNPRAVTDLWKGSNNDSMAAADTVRGEYADAIQSRKAALNDQISNTLAKADPNVGHDIQPIIDSINKFRSRFNPKAQPEEIAHIDDLISRVKAFSEDGKTVNSEDLNRIKKMLQGIGEGAYVPEGQVFNRAGTRAQAAKSGAAGAREVLNAAHPEIAEANNQLARLHEIDDSTRANLLEKRAPDAGLVSGGSGTNAKNTKDLKDLGEATGTDMLGRAKELAAGKYLGNPQFFPMSGHGTTSTTRTGMGLGLGTLAGYASGGGAPAAVVGGAIGSMLTSPATLKAAIDTGRVTSQMAAGLLKQPGAAQLGQGLLKQLNDIKNGQAPNQNDNEPVQRLSTAKK